MRFFKRKQLPDDICRHEQYVADDDGKTIVIACFKCDYKIVVSVEQLINGDRIV